MTLKISNFRPSAWPLCSCPPPRVNIEFSARGIPGIRGGHIILGEEKRPAAEGGWGMGKAAVTVLTRPNLEGGGRWGIIFSSSTHRCVCGDVNVNQKAEQGSGKC